MRAKSGYALRHAILGGHLAIARWLAERFDLTAEDARAKDNDALRCAALEGYLEAVQWLEARFGLGPSDVRAGKNAALRGALLGGHEETVVCLVRMGEYTWAELAAAGLARAWALADAQVDATTTG